MAESKTSFARRGGPPVYGTMARCFGDIRELVEKKKKRVTAGTPWWRRCSRRGERLGFAGRSLGWGLKGERGKLEVWVVES
jgi:hypothetical protein